MVESLRSPSLTAHGFEHAFSLRLIGDASAEGPHSRGELARTLGIPASRIGEVEQVHGDRSVEWHTDQDREALRLERADAVFTARKGHAVAVRTADCVPILIADPRSGAALAIHAGWRGAVAEIVLASVRGFCGRIGASPLELIAAIGPHIRRASFEVGEEVAEAIARAGLRVGVQPVDRSARTPHACLATLVTGQLRAVGLVGDRIDDVGGDTYAERRFDSYRRDGARAGRQLSVVVAR